MRIQYNLNRTMGRPYTLRSRDIPVFIFTTFLTGVLGLAVQAQSVPVQSAPAPAAVLMQQATNHDLSDVSEQQSGADIRGTVTDPAGDVVVGAQVKLEIVGSKGPRTQPTDSAGAFRFTGLPPGTYQVTVTSNGFADWEGTKIVLAAGEDHYLPEIVLQIASVTMSVRAVSSQYELAEEQMHVEETQRVLGVFPNFYTTYVWNAEPLTSGQKFRLAWRTSIDPVTIVFAGVVAGIEQWQNDFSGYGQGSEGYAKRFGASYADGFLGVMIGSAVLPSLLHQDPRYFYKGTGSVRSRAFYAISTVFICKGDNGRWQPNYSNVLGDLAAAGASNLYYPASNRNGANVTIDNALLGLAGGAVNALFQEFLFRKISRGAQSSPSTHN